MEDEPDMVSLSNNDDGDLRVDTKFCARLWKEESLSVRI